ncbi:hypothetical protein IOK_02726 [Yersinia enterocolitica subsp. palearctica PhRBD_Ye1]|nr:hypothetical protein IOK_02726 [Yersinia enterocolitica subsp. palearctica PhRBD_Ye1]
MIVIKNQQTSQDLTKKTFMRDGGNGFVIDM